MESSVLFYFLYIFTNNTRDRGRRQDGEQHFIFIFKKTIPQNGDEDDVESSGGEETVEGAAGAQDSGREEGEEDESTIVHPKSRSSMLSRTKRNRLVRLFLAFFCFSLMLSKRGRLERFLLVRARTHTQTLSTH
jgi:hypothetical protein